MSSRALMLSAHWKDGLRSSCKLYGSHQKELGVVRRTVTSLGRRCGSRPWLCCG